MGVNDKIAPGYLYWIRAHRMKCSYIKKQPCGCFFIQKVFDPYGYKQDTKTKNTTFIIVKFMCDVK